MYTRFWFISIATNILKDTENDLVIFHLVGLTAVLNSSHVYRVVYPMPSRMHGILGDAVIKQLLKEGNEVNDAWNRIADSINVPVNDLKKKKESLMTTFRTHHKKKIQSIKSGMGEDEQYNPIWPFYEPLEAFLRDVYECCSVINTETNEVIDSSSTREYEAGPDNDCSVIDINTTKSKVPSIKRRRSINPPELTQAGKEMANAFGRLNKVLENKTEKQDDDCDLYAKLLATKLRKFSENEREELMLDIDTMLLNRRRQNRPSSSQSSEQYEWSRSPYNRPHSSQSLPSSYATIINQSPQDSHSAYYVQKPQSQRIHILSDGIISQSYVSQPSLAQTQQASSSEPVVLRLPESDEMMNDQSTSILYQAYENASNHIKHIHEQPK